MIAYADCVSGASGDMLLGALVDAGWPIEELAGVVNALGLGGRVDVSASQVMRGPLAATHVSVRSLEEDPPHRHLPEIETLLAGSRLDSAVTDRAIAVFRRMARAEAKVHGSEPELVHFHEVGALDAIVDIAGAVAGFAALRIDELGCSAFPLGDGWTTSLHGPIPLPAPATLHLLAEAGAPTTGAPEAWSTARTGELVTPTGAAILCELATFNRPPMTLSRVSHGAGTREMPWPNVLRLWLGTPPGKADVAAERAVLVETTLDDSTPEVISHAAERLMAAGALDVWLTPAQMKKGRPGTVLSTLAPPALEAEVVRTLLLETSTLGVRVHEVRRHVAARDVRMVETRFGSLPIKLKLIDDEVRGSSPEFEACRAAAQQHEVSLQEVYAAVLEASGSEPG